MTESRAGRALDWLLDGETERFWDAYEHRPLHLPGTSPDRFASLFSLDDLERYLVTARPGPDQLRLVGADPPLENVHDPQHILHAWRDGATLILNGVHRRWPPLLALTQDLRACLRADVGVNVYCTAARGRGFPRHIDGHDVLVLQVHGAKRWRLFQPQHLLPLETAHGDLHSVMTGAIARPSAGGPSASEPNASSELELLAETTLAAGDVLYIPRGVPHEALVQAEGSLHLSVGIQPLRWVDYLHAAVDVLAAHHVELRRSLPRHLSADALPHPAAALAWALDVDADANANAPLDLSGATLASWMQAARAPDVAVPGGTFRSLLVPTTDITLDTELTRRPGGDLHFGQRDARLWLRLCGCRMHLPLEASAAVDFLARTPRFRIRALPDVYTDATKLLLGRAWVAEGFVLVG